MRIKGTVLLARRAFAHKHFGKDAWEKVLAVLPAEDQATLRKMILNVGWFPFKLGERLDEAIVGVLAGGDERVFERIGRISAEENLTGAQQQFLVPGDIHAFLRQTPEIYRFYYDNGHRTYEKTGPTSAVLTTFDADTFSHADCLTIIGWHKRALEMCGAQDIKMTEEACRSRGQVHCRYRVEWSSPA
jgi:hypothetical protein